MISCTPTACVRAYREVALVADEHDGHVGVGMLPGIVQPAGQVVESLTPASADSGTTTALSVTPASQMITGGGLGGCGLCTAAD